MHSMLHNTNPRPLLTPSVPRPRHFSGAGRTIRREVGGWQMQCTKLCLKRPNKSQCIQTKVSVVGTRAYGSISATPRSKSTNATDPQSTDKNKLAQIRHTIAFCLTNHATSFQSSAQASHFGSSSHITNDGANKRKKTAAMRNTARMGSQLLQIKT